MLNHLLNRLKRLLFSFCLLLTNPLLADNFHGNVLDAVFLTLENEQAIAASNQQIVSADGQVLTGHSIFETTINTGISQQLNNTPGYIQFGQLYPGSSSNLSGFNLGVTQRLSYGLTINPVLSMNRLSENYVNQAAISVANAAINFTLPLLQGWGTAVNTAPEVSAKMAREAATYNYSHVLTASITQTVVSYWNYLGAKKLLDVAKIAEERSKSLLTDAHKLVQGEIIPASDILKYETKLAAAISDRIAANQNLINARGLLLNAMNIFDDMEGNFTPPEESFPEPEQANLSLLNNPEKVAKLITETKDRRFDVIAANYSRQSAEITATAASLNNKSQLDLTVNVGYNSLAIGNSLAEPFLAFNNLPSGPTAGVSLNYVIPVTSSANRGLVLQTAAAFEQAKIQHAALSNSATNNARVQINNLRTTIDELEQARKQVNFQTDVYRNEKRKYKAGLSTIIDLFTQESLLTTNQQSLVVAQTDFSNALIQFRFYTGTLLTHDQDGQNLTLAELTTLSMPLKTR